MIRKLGDATGGVVNEGANLQIALLVFIVVFGAWCMLLIPAQTLARGWREAGRLRRSGPGRGGPAGRPGRRSRRHRSRRARAGALMRAVVPAVRRLRETMPGRDTRRPLPWLFAALLVMIFLVPFDAMQLKVALPVSSDFDRFLVIG